jgi:hypothetical protein
VGKKKMPARMMVMRDIQKHAFRREGDGKERARRFELPTSSLGMRLDQIQMIDAVRT